MKKKYLVCLALLSAALLVLAACGGQQKAGKDESEIAKDIQHNDMNFDRYGLTLESFSEIKRQTNSEDKTDFVWFEVHASNQRFTYQGTYELGYVLYNDGWQLEEFRQTGTKITPLSYPTEETATAAMEEIYPDCKFLGSGYDYDKNTAQFLFERTETINYATTVYDIMLDYSFYASEGWTSTYQEEERTTRPEIVGEWRYEEQNEGAPDDTHTKSKSYYIKILSCSDETVQFEYDLSTVEHRYTFSDDWHDEETHEKSNGPIEAPLYRVEHNYPYYEYYIDYNVPAFRTIWLRLGPGTEGYCEAGISVDGCTLTKVS